MKNKKGEIATLLTLGLVVVGTLITLGTSLFVSNKKSNLASSSKAACPKGVAIPNSTYFKCAAGCGKTSGGSCPNYEHNSLDSSCGYCGTAAAAPAAQSCTASCVTSSQCKAGSGLAIPAGGWSNCGAGSTCCAASGVITAPTAQSCTGSCVTSTQCKAGFGLAIPAGGWSNCSGGNTCCSASGVISAPAGPAVGAQGGACRSAAPKCDGALVCNTNNICAANTSQGQTANQITNSTVTGEGQSCCFQKKGKVYVFASYQAMVNSDMLDDAGNPDCKRQTASVVSSYLSNGQGTAADIAMGAFVCAGGTANMTSVEDYNATNPANGASGDQKADDLEVPEGCKSTDCKSYFTSEPNFSSEVLISTSEVAPLSYFKSGDCTASSKVGGVNDLYKYCKDQSSAQASVTCVPNLSCKEAYGGNGNKYSYSIDASGTTTYYKGNSCYGTPKATGEADVKAYCTLDPDAEKNATCNKNILCSSIGSTNTSQDAKISSKSFNGTTVYYDSPDSCDSQSMTKADAITTCNSKPQTVPIGIENPIGETISKDGVTYFYCFAKTDNSVFENDPMPLINKCKNFYGDDYEIGRKWDNYYCCKKL